MHILIVDDSPEDRTTIRWYLSEASLSEGIALTLTQAELGAAGLAACQTATPDCILLDYFLPDMNGLEFLARLRQPDGSLLVPVVMLTGVPDTALPALSLRAGAQEYLPKRLMEPELLMLAIKSAQDRHALLAERQRATTALEQSEKLLRLSHEAGGIASFQRDHDEDTIIWAANSQCLLGFSSSQAKMPLAAWEAAIAQDDLPRILAERAANVTHRRAKAFYAFQLRRPDSGAIRHIEARVHTMFDAGGRPSRSNAALIDVTERQLAEANLQAAIELSPGILYRAQLCGNRVAVVEMHGDFRRVIGGAENNPLAFLTQLLSTPRTLQAIQSKSGNDNLIIVFPTESNGQTLWIRNTIRVSRKTEFASDLVGYLSDVTSERTDHLRSQQVSTLLTLGEMATGIAHELSQPLSTISFAAQNAALMLQRDTFNRTAIINKFEVINKAATRTAQLIQHMQIFSRSARAESSGVLWSTALKSAMLMLNVEAHGCTLDVDLPDDLPPVFSTSIDLEHLLICLISNAIDAYETAASPGARQVSVRGRVEGGMVRLRVEDHAGGIPADVLPHVFEPFFTTKGPQKGTGLGLALCFGTVTRMGGTIVASNVNGGAAFEVSLPRASLGSGGISIAQ